MLVGNIDMEENSTDVRRECGSPGFWWHDSGLKPASRKLKVSALGP